MDHMALDLARRVTKCERDALEGTDELGTEAPSAAHHRSVADRVSRAVASVFAATLCSEQPDREYDRSRLGSARTGLRCLGASISRVELERGRHGQAESLSRPQWTVPVRAPSYIHRNPPWSRRQRLGHRRMARRGGRRFCLHLVFDEKPDRGGSHARHLPGVRGVSARHQSDRPVRVQNEPYASRRRALHGDRFRA